MSQLPFNFLGLPVEATQYDEAPVVIVPVPWEKTTSYKQGTRQGPQAIIEASHQVEFYDAEWREEPWSPALHTVPPLDFGRETGEVALQRIEKSVGALLDNRKFPILLGGEHTLSAGGIAAAAKRYPDLSILQIDAHADLRESYEGTPYSHACAMRLGLRYAKKLVGVGIRSLCSEEAEYAKSHPNVTLLHDALRRKNPKWIEEALRGLSNTVYLTIDVDGFDPSLIPATGTPEPGGLSWYEGLELIRAVFAQKKVVAADVVELLPMASHHASSFVAAKLVYKLVGYRKHAPH